MQGKRDHVIDPPYLICVVGNLEASEKEGVQVKRLT